MQEVYCRPRRIDSEADFRPVEKYWLDENKRRRRSVEDDYRQDSMKHLRPGEFHYSCIPIHETYQNEYLKRYGKAINGNDWRCPKCGTLYAMGYPPLQCNVCRCISPLGQLVQDGYYKK